MSGSNGMSELLEYSVVYTERALNHMSPVFQSVMCDLSAMLQQAYGGDAVALVPGGGTFAMEAVARQFGYGQQCLVVQNGWFSYRWLQIFEQCGLTETVTVLQARPLDEGPQAQFAPVPIEEVEAAIHNTRPALVCAAHVETSAGLILPPEYLQRMAAATHDVGGVFVLDCIASGAIWVDMKATGVDVVITAPQKGWTSTPCAGVVVMRAAAKSLALQRTSNSYACDLGRWIGIMDAYEDGGHAYHATMPTDGLHQFRDVMHEANGIGLDVLETRQWELGRAIRAICDTRWTSLAPKPFASPSVVVCHALSHEEHKGIVFKEQGMQIAAGVPLACGEHSEFRTFRIGLFGLDKLMDVPASVAAFQQVIDAL